MERVPLKHITLGHTRFPDLKPAVHRICLGLFLVSLGLAWLRLWPELGLFEGARWPEGVLVLLTTATTLASLARQLPTQNVMLAACTIAFIGGAIHTVGALSGVPFGSFTYTRNVGQTLFDPLPWAMPLLWVIAVLNARGVGRLILRSWRSTRNYGLWLMGTTAVFVVLFDLALEPLVSIKDYWLWTPPGTSLTWYSAPWINFLGWGVSAILILAFATPALINKRPGEIPVDYHSLLVWIGLNFFLATADIRHGLWPAAIYIGASTAVAVLLALLGAQPLKHPQPRAGGA